MTAPRLEIRLDRIRHNAQSLIERLARRGITVTAVTKAILGSPEVARELLAAGASALGDSRIENIEGMRAAGITAPITLIRTPMLEVSPPSLSERYVGSQERQIQRSG